MFYILFFNALLFLECFGSSQLEALVSENIAKSLFYHAGQVYLDRLPTLNLDKLSHKPVLVSLLYDKNIFPSDHFKLTAQQFKDFLVSQSKEYADFFAREAMTSLNFIPTLLGQQLSYLFGFNIPQSQLSSEIVVPNMTAFNIRFKIYRDYFQRRHPISGSQNIAKISFYSVSEKITDPSFYLKQLALRRLPIAWLADGGGVISFHDLIHLMTFMLPEDLVAGYVQFARDSIVFIETQFITPEIKNYLYSIISRSIDAEIANFISDFFNIFVTTEHDNGISYRSKYRDYAALQSLQKKAMPRHSSSAERKNTFFEHMTEIFNMNKESTHFPIALLKSLEIFKRSNDPIRKEIESHIYWPNGPRLYFKAREHLLWMREHAEESHDIHNILPLPTK